MAFPYPHVGFLPMTKRSDAELELETGVVGTLPVVHFLVFFFVDCPVFSL